MAGAGDDTLHLAIRPAYLGAHQQDPGPRPVSCGEPEGTRHRRGQTQWDMQNGDIVGRAYTPAGPNPHTRLAYFRGPERPRVYGKMRLPHPILSAQAGAIEVYPITNPDPRLLKAQGCR
jgi:hypothetical protein